MDSTGEREEASMEILKTINDLSHIVKGKRTKRQRPQSPIPFNITTHSSTAAASTNNDDVLNSSSPLNSEEDEDTAKCLILLSQGQGPSPDSPNIINHNEEELGTIYKFTSKRYIETSTTGNGKAGIYVYECKTCNRTFPSFQALGGHRASHKKPKPPAPDDRKRPLIMPLSDEEQPQFKHNNNSNNYINNGLSLQLGNRPALYSNSNTNNNNNNIHHKSGCSKVHECAICGAEFTSGQALGGHMRRHRGPVVAAGAGGANTTLSLSPTNTPIGIDHNYSPEETNKKARTGFFLDLNLPAAPEPEDQEVVNNGESTAPKFSKHQQNQTTTTTHHHHHQQQQQQQQQQKQQSPLVLSAAPTLVDCHN